MENLVNVYLFGKRYQVPESLTIMKAMEYAGYQLSCLPDAGGGGHVCGDVALFPVGEADLRY